MICLAVAVSGFTQKAFSQQKITVDKIIANVGNSTILYSEVEEVARQLVAQRRQEGYTTDRDPFFEALENLLQVKLMYNQAIVDSIKINTGGIDNNVDTRVREMIAQAGSTSALEATYRMPIFDIKDNLRTKFEEQAYASSMTNEIIGKVKITPGEVETYYNAMNKDSIMMVPDQYVYAQITKYPPSLAEAKQRVRESLLNLRERIIGGSSFEALAASYSMDEGTSKRGGDLGTMPLDTYVPTFAKALEKLKPGQISEIVETDFGFHIIKMVAKVGNDYHAKHILLRPSFTNEELGQAGRFLDSIAKQIRAGEITFEEAARKFSDDRYSKINGGLVTNNEILETNPNYFNADYTTFRFFKEQIPSDWRAISTLKVGEISESFMTQDLRGNELSKIVKLIELIPTHKANLNEDYLIIEKGALQEKQFKHMEKWMESKIGSMYIWIDPALRDGLENKIWLK